MNAIEGFTGIMLKKMAGSEYNEKTERYLKKVKANSTRLLALINDFLDLSRIEAGRMELIEEPLSPRELALEWQGSLSSLAYEKGLDFKLAIDPSLPETIYTDGEALTKIATNLIGNAIKFTERGSIAITWTKSSDTEMKIDVSDTGMGIPPHAREYIFDEFRQVDQSSKRKHGGTGLGLAIVQRVARELKGRVTVESELDKGSTFTVTLPLKTGTN